MYSCTSKKPKGSASGFQEGANAPPPPKINPDLGYRGLVLHCLTTRCVLFASHISCDPVKISHKQICSLKIA